MSLRFLQANGYKYDKSWNSIKDYSVWRKEKLPIQFNSKIETFLVNFYLSHTLNNTLNRTQEFYISMDVIIALGL